MREIIISILLSISCMQVASQTAQSYSLELGETYFLKQVMHQNTHSEAVGMRANISLDIGSTLLAEVTKIRSNGNYQLLCSYENLELSFFSPQNKISISSRNNAFSPINAYLEELEKHYFTVEMSRSGEFLEVYQLDSILTTFFTINDPDPGRKDLIVKTVSEAFGVGALKGLANMALYLYNDSLINPFVNETFITFNAKAMDITNRFFYQETDDNKLRVQGIGLIAEIDENIQIDDISVDVRMKGSQTYDYLIDRSSGWLIKGSSKQKVNSVSTIYGSTDLPQGLEMPSLTESEFEFKGGRYMPENPK